MASLTEIAWGNLASWSFLSGTFATFTLDEATDQIEFIFQAREAATITRLGFRYGVRTGTPPTFKISLQGVDGSGRSDGTIKGGGTPASATFTPPADTSWNSTWQWLNLDNSLVIARGDMLSVVIIYSAGTINGSNSSSFTTSLGAFRDDGGLPYNVTFNATGSVITRNASLPVWGYGSAGTAYGRPASAYSAVTINVNTTPDEIALAFTLPTGLASSYAVVGAEIGFSTFTAATTHKLALYSGTTVLQDVTIDSDWTVATIRPQQRFFFDEATLSVLTPGTKYYLAYQPQAATNVALDVLDVAAAADLAGWPAGADLFYASRTDLGAWTDLTTRRPLIVPLLADITGSGSLLLNPSLEGM